MSWWDRLKGQAGAQFLDVIQWLDDSNDTIVYRFPIHDQAITDQSKVIVREAQAAVFIAEGQMSDVFSPGTYTLNTPNTPIMSFFNTIAYAFNNPYKGDILFVSTHQFTDNGWGTQNPFLKRDPDFGPIRVRAFGTYAFRVTDPAVFIRQVVGTDGVFTTSEIAGHIKKRVVSNVSASIQKSGIPVLDLVGNYEELGKQVRDDINPEFAEALGIQLTDLTIGNISLPKEVEEALDNRSKMGILGDINAYTQLKTADAIEHAAKNPGMGGAGVGMGVGIGFGHTMAGQMAGGGGGHFNPHTGMHGPPPTTPTKFHYDGPGGQRQATAAEIAALIAANRGADHKVWANGWADWKPWSAVPEVASLVPPPSSGPPPAPSTPPPPPGAATFHYHGDGGKGEKTVDEIVAAVRATPDGKHHVWQNGWDDWKHVSEVDAIVSALRAGPPPPPGEDDGPPPPPA